MAQLRSTVILASRIHLSLDVLHFAQAIALYSSDEYIITNALVIMTKLTLIAVALGLTLSYGCDSSNPSDAPQDTGKDTTSTSKKGVVVSGFVRLHKDCAAESDHSGVRVTLGQRSTLTDSRGYWSIDSVLDNGYYVRYSKEGYHEREGSATVTRVSNDTVFILAQPLTHTVQFGGRIEGDPTIWRQVQYIYRDSVGIDSNGVRVSLGRILSDSIVRNNQTFRILAEDEAGTPDATIKPILFIANRRDVDPLVIGKGVVLIEAYHLGQYPFRAEVSAGIFEYLGLKSGDTYYAGATGTFACHYTGGQLYVSAKKPMMQPFVVP